MKENHLNDLRYERAVVAALEDNFAKKVTTFPAQHPEMVIHCEGDVVYVDTSIASDSFNCAFGGSFTQPESRQYAEKVRSYYRQKQLPMAWWMGPSSDADSRRAILEDVGFTQNEVEIGMAALLHDVHLEVEVPTELQIEPVNTPSRLEDFGKVLASVFDPVDTEVCRYYAKIAPYLHASDSPARLFVGYVEGAPVATGGVFLSDYIAGIYDIATNPHFRNRGYGTALMAVALQAARESGHEVVGLQASSDGLRIYQRLGFKPFCEFHVYGIQG